MVECRRPCEPTQGVSDLFGRGMFKQKRRDPSLTIEEQVGHNSKNLTPELLKKLTDPSMNHHSRRAATPGGKNDRREAVRKGSITGGG